MNRNDPLAKFAGISKVVADDLRFKRKLAIGEDAYTSLRFGKVASRIWDVGGVAATGAGVAASAPVATFFSSSSLLASLGFGAAAITPVGWVVTAAVVTGGAYYGVTRAMGAYTGSRVEVIPKFINSPIDQLGAALLDMMGTLGLKVAMMDGVIDSQERAAMADFFVSEWGYDNAYVSRALELIEAEGLRYSIKELTAEIAAFVQANPDCNAEAFRVQLLDMLREVAMADGTFDEREDLAIDAIGAVFANTGGVADTVGTAVGTVGTVASQAVGTAGDAAQVAANLVLDAGQNLARRVKRFANVMPSLFTKQD